MIFRVPSNTNYSVASMWDHFRIGSIHVKVRMGNTMFICSYAGVNSAWHHCLLTGFVQVHPDKPKLTAGVKEILPSGIKCFLTPFEQGFALAVSPPLLWNGSGSLLLLNNLNSFAAPSFCQSWWAWSESVSRLNSMAPELVQRRKKKG